MSKPRFSVLFMSCGTMCILARTLIWQQGPGAFDLSSLLTSTWQFKAAGKVSVAEPGKSSLPPSASLWAFLSMLEPALGGCWKLYLLILLLAVAALDEGEIEEMFFFYVKSNMSTNLARQWEFPLQKKNVKESPEWVQGNGIQAASLLNVTCVKCVG